MSLDELISIERVEFQSTKERLQETYVIADLTLSKLFKEILKEVKGDILPLLNIKILLYVLQSIPFINEIKGVSIHENLQVCMKNQRCGKTDKWNCNKIATNITELRRLILYDYVIDGSLKLSCDDRIEWDLMISITFRE
ncbi:MAG: hypothetical protein ACW98X_19680 [Promethearchaeota archaeon]